MCTGTQQRPGAFGALPSLSLPKRVPAARITLYICMHIYMYNIYIYIFADVYIYIYIRNCIYIYIIYVTCVCM